LAHASRDPAAINRVVLATDGDLNVGITGPDELQGFVERQRGEGSQPSVLGFGQGDHNDLLLQRLAQHGDGAALPYRQPRRGAPRLVEGLTGTLATIARDVKVQLELNPAEIAEYRLIGYEPRLLRRDDFTDDEVDAGEVGAGHMVTALFELAPAGSGGGADRAAALAVAAFGQVLRGGDHLQGFGYDDAVALAQGAKGADPDGSRAELVNLIRAAKAAAALEPLPR
jgi:Ca-activated chloride channel family protein